MTAQSKDPRYEAFLHGFVAAPLLALQDAKAAWARYCADNGFHVSLGEAEHV